MTAVRTMVIAAITMVTPTLVSASLITINQRITLHESQIYDCGGQAYPSGTLCWSPSIPEGQIAIRRRTVEEGDTVRLHLKFDGPYLLQWADDGIVSIGGIDEQVQVSYSNSLGPGGYNNGSWSNFLSFSGVRGRALKANNLSWTISFGSSGGLVSQSQFSGTTNFTDSFFRLAGLTAEIGPFSGGTGRPGRHRYARRVPSKRRVHNCPEITSCA